MQWLPPIDCTDTAVNARRDGSGVGARAMETSEDDAHHLVCVSRCPRQRVSGTGSSRRGTKIRERLTSRRDACSDCSATHVRKSIAGLNDRLKPAYPIAGSSFANSTLVLRTASSKLALHSSRHVPRSCLNRTRWRRVAVPNARRAPLAPQSRNVRSPPLFAGFIALTACSKGPARSFWVRGLLLDEPRPADTSSVSIRTERLICPARPTLLVVALPFYGRGYSTARFADPIAMPARNVLSNALAWPPSTEVLWRVASFPAPNPPPRRRRRGFPISRTLFIYMEA